MRVRGREGRLVPEATPSTDVKKKRRRCSSFCPRVATPPQPRISPREHAARSVIVDVGESFLTDDLAAVLQHQFLEVWIRLKFLFDLDVGRHGQEERRQEANGREGGGCDGGEESWVGKAHGRDLDSWNMYWNEWLVIACGCPPLAASRGATFGGATSTTAARTRSPSPAHARPHPTSTSMPLLPSPSLLSRHVRRFTDGQKKNNHLRTRAKKSPPAAIILTRFRGTCRAPRP